VTCAECRCGSAAPPPASKRWLWVVPVVVVGLAWLLGGCAPDGTVVWERPHAVPNAGDADVLVFAFTGGAPGPLDVTAAHGLPAAASVDGLSITPVARADRPSWFAGFDDPAVGLRRAAPGAPEVGGAWIIQVKANDPMDLGHLQVAWAALRAAVDAGAFVALDAHTTRWVTPGEVPAPDAPLDPESVAAVVCTPDPVAPFGHTCHTRGLRKVGRPDLIVTGLAGTDLGAAAAALRAHARLLTLGFPVAAGDDLPWPDGTTGETSEWSPGINAPPLELDASALVVRYTGPGGDGAR
jgi:hypothetical protein